MKHFIAFVILGIAAIGSGMVLANHFAMPESRTVPSYPSEPVEVSAPADTSGSSLRDIGMPSLPDLPSALPDLPSALPDPKDAVSGAGRAFGKATGTMEYYSDRAFGSTARKAKQAVDQAKMPGMN